MRQHAIENTSTAKYRADIDGLRAIAVLLVALFHINESTIPGGFIGVDMFFVISGFLITGTILRDLKTGKFSYREFYRRRIRRIAPAMGAVTAAVVLFGTLILLPKDVEDLSWSAIATVFSAANIYFTYFLDTSYFAADSGAVPLLHMWSLGVEEQFYLLWPTTLLFLLRWPRAVLPAVLVISLASIAVGEWLISSGAFSWAYYMLPSRAYELSAGAILAIWSNGHRVAPSRWLALSASLLGLVLVFSSAYLLNGDSPFPGYNGVPVTFGTVLLLWGGSVPHLVSSLLSLRPVRWIGLISYSLYLWHWPVLAFQRYLYGDLSVFQQIASFVLMLAFADLTCRFVEEPFRRSRRNLKVVALRHFAIPAAAIAALCHANISSLGYGPWVLTDYRERLAAYAANNAPAPAMKYVCQARALKPDDLVDPNCIINGTEEPDVLLWGDSNASHYVGAVSALAREIGFSFRNFAHASCPSLLQEPERFVPSRAVDYCRNSSRLAHARLDRYSTIILSSSWDSGISRGPTGAYIHALEETVRTLRGRGKTVLLLGRIPRLRDFDPVCEKKRLKAEWISCPNEFADARERVERTNSEIRRVAKTTGALYADFTKILCGPHGCVSRLDEEIIYFDQGHISGKGSEKLGGFAIRSDELLRVFSLLDQKDTHSHPQEHAGSPL